LRLERSPGHPRELPCGRRLEAVLIEKILAPEHRRQDVEVRHRVPAAFDARDRLGRGKPAAPLLADLVDDVRQIDEILVIETGEDGAHEVDDVVTRSGRVLRGDAGGQLEMRNAVDPDLDAVLGSPLLDDLVEPYVVRRHEVTPLKDTQDSAPGLGGSPAGGEHDAEPGRPGDGGLQESATLGG